MYKTLTRLLPLCFFQVSTAVVPYAPLTIIGFIFFQFLVAAISIFQVMPISLVAILALLASLVIPLLSLRVLTGFYNKTNRWIKMSVAIFGVSTIFTIMGLMLLVVPITLLFALLSLWKFCVNLKIYRETLEVNPWIAGCWVFVVELTSVLPLLAILPEMPLE